MKIIKIGWEHFAVESASDAVKVLEILEKAKRVTPEWAGKRFFVINDDPLELEVHVGITCDRRFFLTTKAEKEAREAAEKEAKEQSSNKEEN